MTLRWMVRTAREQSFGAWLDAVDARMWNREYDFLMLPSGRNESAEFLIQRRISSTVRKGDVKQTVLRRSLADVVSVGVLVDGNNKAIGIEVQLKSGQIFRATNEKEGFVE